MPASTAACPRASRKNVLPVPDGPHTTRFSRRRTHSRVRRAAWVGGGIEETLVPGLEGLAGGETGCRAVCATLIVPGRRALRRAGCVAPRPAPSVAPGRWPGPRGRPGGYGAGGAGAAALPGRRAKAAGREHEWSPGHLTEAGPASGALGQGVFLAGAGCCPFRGGGLMGQEGIQVVLAEPPGRGGLPQRPVHIGGRVQAAQLDSPGHLRPDPAGTGRGGLGQPQAGTVTDGQELRLRRGPRPRCPSRGPAGAAG